MLRARQSPNPVGWRLVWFRCALTISEGHVAYLIGYTIVFNYTHCMHSYRDSITLIYMRFYFRIKQFELKLKQPVSSEI